MSGKLIEKPGFWIVLLANLFVIGMLFSTVFSALDTIVAEARLIREENMLLRTDVKEEISIIAKEVEYLRTELEIVYELDEKLQRLLGDSLEVKAYVQENSVAGLSYEEQVKTAFSIVLASERHFEGNECLLWYYVYLINEESHFNPQARSHVAYGPAQVTKDTFEWLGYVDEDIWDIETNIDAGAKFVRYLVDIFEGNLVLVTAGYNAGVSRVRSWVSTGVWDGKFETVNQIPFRETRNHVLKVLDNRPDQAFSVRF